MKVSLESSVMLFTDYWESDCQHLQDFSFNKISSLLTAYQCESLLFLQFYQILSIHYVLEKYWHDLWSGTIFFSKTSRKSAAESSVDLLYSPPSPIHPTFTDWGMRPCGVPFTPQITLEKTSPHPSRTKLLKPLWFRASYHERGWSFSHRNWWKSGRVTPSLTCRSDIGKITYCAGKSKIDGCPCRVDSGRVCRGMPDLWIGLKQHKEGVVDIC